ncbi:hypothetical protein BDN72DRAFT_783524 [Pluteus cervinus]|uniref:Uncharacterized protein n=1 Tax=Pluteus cervinus TaxID=181527 RepID=A0ACD3BIL1_9AGAR|nr:hypothetical protein BDN72DRAFT_783524 [Pluteus cervinus]
MPYHLGRTISKLSYATLILLTTIATGLSCAALLSQAVRTSPTQAWKGNINALVIGAAYTMVFVVSFLFCIKRRVAVKLRLHRISKAYRNLGRGDVPKPVHEYITQEYFRACLVFYESLPKNAVHAGWSMLGTDQVGTEAYDPRSKPEEQLVHFRREILDLISRIDVLAHIVIPTHPPLKPHVRMLHHFRFLSPLLETDEDGLTALHYFDSAVQVVRMSSRELTRHEFEIGRNAAEEIISSLDECRLEMEHSIIRRDTRH